MGKPSSVIVVGGGIAGMAAAVRLAERGVAVTLLETRKKLGGRATSFVDVRSGEVLDNCQHVVLGCCTSYLDLLGRLGSADKLRWHKEQYWVEEGGRTSVIRPGLLPAPLHFTGSLLRAKFLTVREVMAIGRAAAKMLRARREAWGTRTFAEFLRRCRQPERVIRRFWSPVVVSACNMEVDRVAASSALQVFQEGFFPSARAAEIGVPSVPLVGLYERVEGIVAKAGGRVVLGAGVSHLDERSATTSDGQRFEGERMICALPVERVGRVVDENVRNSDARFAPLELFTHSPILGVHLKFDRPVMAALPHAVLVDRPTQWLFRKDEKGEQLHAVISAADSWMMLSEEEIVQRVEADVRACLPGTKEARLEWARSVKEKLATWAPLPGTDELRPSATGTSGVILAGDYTATGWPATMEGATRSGYAAAEACVWGEGVKA